MGLEVKAKIWLNLWIKAGGRGHHDGTEPPGWMFSPRQKRVGQNRNTAENWNPELLWNELDLLQGSTPPFSVPPFLTLGHRKKRVEICNHEDVPFLQDQPGDRNYGGLPSVLPYVGKRGRKVGQGRRKVGQGSKKLQKPWPHGRSQASELHLSCSLPQIPKSVSWCVRLKSPDELGWRSNISYAQRIIFSFSCWIHSISHSAVCRLVPPSIKICNSP